MPFSSCSGDIWSICSPKKSRKKSICNLTIGQEISYTLELLVWRFQFPNSRFLFSISSWQSVLFLFYQDVVQGARTHPPNSLARHTRQSPGCEQMPGKSRPRDFFSQPQTVYLTFDVKKNHVGMHSRIACFEFIANLGKKHIPFGQSTWLTVPKRYVNTDGSCAIYFYPGVVLRKLSFISGYPFQGWNSLDWFILSAEATIGLVGQGPLFEAWWFDASIEVILRVSSGKRWRFR